jgi:hypothetical protein
MHKHLHHTHNTITRLEPTQSCYYVSPQAKPILNANTVLCAKTDKCQAQARQTCITSLEALARGSLSPRLHARALHEEPHHKLCCKPRVACLNAHLTALCRCSGHLILREPLGAAAADLVPQLSWCTVNKLHGLCKNANYTPSHACAAIIAHIIVCRQPWRGKQPHQLYIMPHSQLHALSANDQSHQNTGCLLLFQWQRIKAAHSNERACSCSPLGSSLRTCMTTTWQAHTGHGPVVDN